MKYLNGLVMIAIVGIFPSLSNAGSVKPGDLITPENASAVADLVSPGNFYLRCADHRPIWATGRIYF